MTRIARLTRLTMIAALMVGGAAATSSAQTATSDRGYVEFTVGPTFGDTSSASFGGEGGFFLTEMFGIYAEGGKIQDVATSDITGRAATIARAIGATATAKQPVTYFDAGVIVRIPLDGMFEPYVSVGIGQAKVTNNVTFAVNGSDVTGQLLTRYGVQLGGDLSGDYTHVFFAAGLGAHVKIGSRLLGDVSYRFGQIGQHSDTEQAAIKTNRFQLGAGIRF